MAKQESAQPQQQQQQQQQQYEMMGSVQQTFANGMSVKSEAQTGPVPCKMMFHADRLPSAVAVQGDQVRPDVQPKPMESRSCVVLMGTANEKAIETAAEHASVPSTACSESAAEHAAAAAAATDAPVYAEMKNRVADGSDRDAMTFAGVQRGSSVQPVFSGMVSLSGSSGLVAQQPVSHASPSQPPDQQPPAVLSAIESSSSNVYVPLAVTHQPAAGNDLAADGCDVISDDWWLPFSDYRLEDYYILQAKLDNEAGRPFPVHIGSDNYENNCGFPDTTFNSGGTSLSSEATYNPLYYDYDWVQWAEPRYKMPLLDMNCWTDYMNQSGHKNDYPRQNRDDEILELFHKSGAVNRAPAAAAPPPPPPQLQQAVAAMDAQIARHQLEAPPVDRPGGDQQPGVPFADKPTVVEPAHKVSVISRVHCRTDAEKLPEYSSAHINCMPLKYRYKHTAKTDLFC